MKTLLLSIATLLITSRAVAQVGTPLAPASDETAIREVVHKIGENWSNHQFQDMATYTTPDVSWVNIMGMWWRCRPAVQQAHQGIFDAMFKGVAFTPGQPVIRLITPDVAVVNMYCGVGAFYPPDGMNRGVNKAGDDQNIITLVMVKQQGKWLLTAGQNTIVDARAALNNPMK